MARIYLVGFMGSGKTSTGQALASRLHWKFVDLDECIQRALKRSIREIFMQLGEATFRSEEKRQLLLTSQEERVVIAVGGGTFVSARNRTIMKNSGVTVFLDVPWGEILRRLPGKQEDRPLFRSPEDALSLYRARLPFYRMADITVKPFFGEDPEALAGRIELLLLGRRCVT